MSDTAVSQGAGVTRCSDKPGMRWQVDDALQLESLHSGLAEPLFAQIDQHREALTQWLAWPPHTQTVDDVRAFIRDQVQRMALRLALPLAVRHHGEVVGVCGFILISRPLGRAEMGYWLAPTHRGAGIITRACRFLFDYAFVELGLSVVQIAAATGNQASRAVCERLGMPLHAVQTHAEQLAHGWVDHAVYRMTASQWLALRAPAPASTTVVIRPAEPQDVSPMVDLLAQLGYPDSDAALQPRLLRLLAHPDARHWVAVRQGVVCGLLSLHFIPQLALEGDFARISYLCVDETVHGLGVGRALMAAASAAAEARGCDRIELHCHQRRTQAHAFYQHLGFVDSPRYFMFPLSGA